MRRPIKGQGFRVVGLALILLVVASFAVPLLFRALTPDRHVRQTDVAGAPAEPPTPGKPGAH